MPPLYVVQQGAKLRINNRRLQVDHEGKTLTRIPLGHVSQVLLFGNIGLTTPAMQTLMSRGIEVVFLSQKGIYRGRLTGSITPHVPLRRAQYERLGQPEFVLGMAKDFVTAKLAHQRVILMRRNRQQKEIEISEAIQTIEAACDAIPRKTRVSGLRGLEGAATAAYFRGFRCLFGPEWRFTSRNRRPPRDPVNVLLSFGYTMMTRLSVSAVEAAGLDPYAGFLHEVVYNRPGLGLDLVEEFRPVVESVVSWCCRSEVIKPDHFEPGDSQRPVVLSETGKKRFIKAFEERLDQKHTHPGRKLQFPLRQCLQEQARQIAQRIKSGQAKYQGMGFR